MTSEPSEDAVIALLRKVDPANDLGADSADEAWLEFLSVTSGLHAENEGRPVSVAMAVPAGFGTRERGVSTSKNGWASRAAFLSAAAALVIVALVAIGLANRQSPGAEEATTNSVVTLLPGAASQATTTSTVAPGEGLTPARSTLPVIAPNNELEAQAEALNPAARVPWGADVPGGQGWAFPGPQRGNAFPIMSLDNEVIGIYVSGLGIITRAQYDDPAIDLEALARERLGDQKYFELLDNKRNPPSP